MGRTYKRNDLHNSRRPKSIREKRQFSKTNRQVPDEFSTDESTGKYNRKNVDFDQQRPEDYQQ